MSVDPTAPASDKERHDCLRKRRFTQRQAERAAAGITERGRPMRAYRCPWCAGWHLATVKR